MANIDIDKKVPHSLNPKCRSKSRILSPRNNFSISLLSKNGSVSHVHCLDLPCDNKFRISRKFQIPKLPSLEIPFVFPEISSIARCYAKIEGYQTCNARVNARVHRPAKNTARKCVLKTGRPIVRTWILPKIHFYHLNLVDRHSSTCESAARWRNAATDSRNPWMDESELNFGSLWVSSPIR